MAYLAELEEKSTRVEIDAGAETVTVRIEGTAEPIEGRRIAANTYSLLVAGRSHIADVSLDGETCTVAVDGLSFRLRVTNERRRRAASERAHVEAGGRREIRAMMPGKVVDVLVAVGAEVKANQGLVIVEAMKMENEIRAPAAGRVLEIHVRPGQTVKNGDALVVIE